MDARPPKADRGLPSAACGLRQRQATLPRLHTTDGAAAFRRLAIVEPLIMAATFAVAVALARTAPPGS